MNADRADTGDLGGLLAQALAKACQGPDHLLRATIQKLWNERALGHVCLRLADWQQRADDSGGVLPALSEWSAGLRLTGLCADGATDAPRLPLVLDAEDRLYLRRDFVAERTIARFVQRRLAEPPRLSALQVRDAFAALAFRPAVGVDIDWQLVAVAAAARSSFALLTGGPGTGKTTTVARLLAVLLHHEPTLRIALCAPTGKAASRLGDALRQRENELTALVPLLARTQPTTLHRLLQYLPIGDSFRVSARAPLAYDVVIVDEASMVDPALLAVLCDALPSSARLLLVGDRDQLAAVAAGQVLGDLCRHAAPELGAGEALAAFVREALSVTLPIRVDAPAIANVVVALRTNYRFGQQLGIGAFATALARREPAAALAALQQGHSDLVLASNATAAMAMLAPALLRAARPQEAEHTAQRLAGVRILTATRHGQNGTDAWNRRVEALLAQHGVRVEDPYYPGRPILVTANDYQNRLYNGDLGVVVRDHDRDGDGQTHVCFATGHGEVRKVAPRRLPAHETAWAMTVHKAQGSEFDEVLLVMPERLGPLWQASLIYTGITRARQRAIVLAEATWLVEALALWPQRSSGLAEALRS